MLVVPSKIGLSSIIPARPDVRSYLLFFFTDTAATEISTLSLHDALPILHSHTASFRAWRCTASAVTAVTADAVQRDRKSTRLNSSHSSISYAVFCLKKKKIRKK